MNVPQKDIDQYRQEQSQRADFWVLPENWDAAQLFKSALTQINYAGLENVIIGFDYPGVDVIRLGRGYDWAVFEQFLIMESEAIRYWRKD